MHLNINENSGPNKFHNPSTKRIYAKHNSDFHLCDVHSVLNMLLYLNLTKNVNENYYVHFIDWKPNLEKFIN